MQVLVGIGIQGTVNAQPAIPPVTLDTDFPLLDGLFIVGVIQHLAIETTAPITGGIAEEAIHVIGELVGQCQSATQVIEILLAVDLTPGHTSRVEGGIECRVIVINVLGLFRVAQARGQCQALIEAFRCPGDLAKGRLGIRRRGVLLRLVTRQRRSKYSGAVIGSFIVEVVQAKHVLQRVSAAHHVDFLGELLVDRAGVLLAVEGATLVDE